MNESATIAETTPLLTDHTVAVYEAHDQAHAAIKKLSDAGYDIKNLSIVGQDYKSEEHPVGFIHTGDRVVSWGQMGAYLGTFWGVLTGSAFFIIPGFGQLIFAGYVIAVLESALIGGAIGLVSGALASLGIPKDSVIEYEAALKAGGFLVIAHGSDAEVQRAKTILASTPATHVDSYSTKDKKHAGCH